MFCQYCGKPLAEDAAFCCACGKATVSAEAPTETPVEPTPAAQQPVTPPQYTAMPMQPPVQPQQPPYPPYQPYPPAKPYDNGSFGWAVLGFFVPLVGLILFLLWKDDKPRSAKRAGLGALVGFIVNILVTVVPLVIGVVALIVEGSSSGGEFYDPYLDYDYYARLLLSFLHR